MQHKNIFHGQHKISLQTLHLYFSYPVALLPECVGRAMSTLLLYLSHPVVLLPECVGRAVSTLLLYLSHPVVLLPECAGRVGAGWREHWQAKQSPPTHSCTVHEWRYKHQTSKCTHTFSIFVSK